MEYRTLELNIVSANDIKDVNLLSKMNVYAVASISGDPQNPQMTRTHAHKDAGTNPTWNFPVKFTVNESLAHQNRLNLEINLISDRTCAGDTLIGTVNIPVKELIDNPGEGSFRHVSYQVRTKSGKDKGSLNLSYKFGEKFTFPAKAAPYPTPTGVYPPPIPGSKQEPVMAYPASGVVGSSGAPPPQQYGYGYPQPQQAGYGYPQVQQTGYGNPQAQRKKNKFGMGMGAGLLGGALGGLLLGDMVSGGGYDGGGYDYGDGYVGGGGYDDGGGYDGGFDGGGGFDF